MNKSCSPVVHRFHLSSSIICRLSLKPTPQCKFYIKWSRISMPRTSIEIGRQSPLCPALLLGTHYSDVIMGAMASQITDVSIICSTVCLGTDQSLHYIIILAFAWLSKHWLSIEHHVYIFAGVSAVELWWLPLNLNMIKGPIECCDKIKNIQNVEINERSFSNPHLRTISLESMQSHAITSMPVQWPWRIQVNGSCGYIENW